MNNMSYELCTQFARDIKWKYGNELKIILNLPEYIPIFITGHDVNHMFHYILTTDEVAKI